MTPPTLDRMLSVRVCAQVQVQVPVQVPGPVLVLGPQLWHAPPFGLMMLSSRLCAFA